ncbi:MAG: class II aldolase/adducin family protein [Armatimonadota bacterium]
MTEKEKQLRQDICEVGWRLWQRGMVASNEGNISARLDEDRIICTPTGVSKGFMDPGEMAVVSMNGEPLSDVQASSEVGLHLAAYDERPDVWAVVHAHPPTATGYAIAGQVPPVNILSETATIFKHVPIAPYATPGTAEVAAAVRPLLAEADVVLMKNHGAVTVAGDLWEAYHRMEVLENFTQTALVAHLLGGAEAIPPDDLETLHEIRRQMGLEHNQDETSAESQ